MKPEDYPLVLRSKDMMKILGVGREKLYEYARRKDFPRLQGCRHILAPRDRFLEWVDQMATDRKSV